VFLELLELTDIYTSPLTLTLWGLFFLNLLFVMISRVPIIWQRYKRKGFPKSIDEINKSKNATTIDCKGMDRVSAVLRKKRYKVYTKDNFFWAVKNRFSPLGTIMFHLSFFLLLIGGVMSIYTKFRAETAVGVGEKFTGNYLWKVLPKVGGVPDVTFTVQKIEPRYYKKFVPINVKVELNTPGGKEVIGINYPYREKGLSFIVKNIDILPLFVIKDEDGREVDGVYVKLNVMNGRPDSFKMLGYNFITVFFADYTEIDREGREALNLPQVLKQTPMSGGGEQPAREVTNPAFFITVLKDEIVVKEKFLKEGESIDFDNYRLEFADLDYWVRLYVGREHGLNVLYTGFVFMIIALSVRFIFYRRDIKGIIEGGQLFLSGKGEFYQVLFDDEFRKVIMLLKEK
jgi:cytochrome c biogenesis protein ResB